ncbi:MAG: baseplate J/gp47 family protein, partial [Chloroflexi bacterium]|nr:baseplate J/gp47 family protein [Chloroflexota bacterium]
RRMGMMGGAVALVALAGGGAILGAYATTTATILLTQGASPLDPVTLTLTVAPDQVSDPTLGIVAGRLVEFPLRAEGAVTATGSTTDGQRAEGVVTFFNHSANEIPIPDQTPLSTIDGVQFLTQRSIRIPSGAPMDVDVRAADRGESGNVVADTIVQMPASLVTRLGGGTVTNKDATTGGSTQVDPQILDTDFDTALSQLRTDLNNQLLQQTTAPEGLEAGEVAFPTTAAGSDVGTTPDRTSVVGQPVGSMPMRASMTGSVLAVKQADLDAVATAVLVAQAASGANLVDGSLVVDLSGPGPDPGTWLATATGRAFDDNIAEATLVDKIKGKTRSVAQGILDDYGSATITLSPDFMPTLPDDPQRISLTIRKPPGGSNP